MRILFIILLPVILYPIILIYFNKYQDILIRSEFAAIERQGLTLTKALALAENQYGLIQNNQISSPALQSLIPKVEYGSNIRARLFNVYGNLIADTKASMKYSPFVKVSPLPAVDNSFSIKKSLTKFVSLFSNLLDRFLIIFSAILFVWPRILVGFTALSVDILTKLLILHSIAIFAIL